MRHSSLTARVVPTGLTSAPGLCPVLPDANSRLGLEQLVGWVHPCDGGDGGVLFSKHCLLFEAVTVNLTAFIMIQNFGIQPERMKKLKEKRQLCT